MGDRFGYQSEAERFAGYKEALAAAGIPFAAELAVEGDSSAEAAIEAMRGLLALDRPPTAVCCYNDMTALGAMKAIRARGLRMPEDVSVTGFDDLFFAAYLDPPLTTVRQPMRQMGRMAMENLFKLMSGDGRPEQGDIRMRVEAELIVRGSTAKVHAEPGRDGKADGSRERTRHG